MQIKCLAVRQNDFIAHYTIQRRAYFIFRPAQVDKRRRMATEGSKFIAKTYIDRRAVNALYGRSRVIDKRPSSSQLNISVA